MKSFIKASVLMMAAGLSVLAVSAKAEPLAIGPGFPTHSWDLPLWEVSDGSSGSYGLVNGTPAAAQFDTVYVQVVGGSWQFEGPGITASDAGVIAQAYNNTTAMIQLSGLYGSVHFDFHFLNSQTPGALDFYAFNGNTLVDEYALASGPLVGPGWNYYEGGFSWTPLYNSPTRQSLANAVPLPSVAFLSPVLLAGFAALGRFRKQRA